MPSFCCVNTFELLVRPHDQCSFSSLLIEISEGIQTLVGGGGVTLRGNPSANI